MAGPAIALPSAALRGSWLSILGSGTANYPPPALMKTFISDILGHAARGEISLDIARRPLAEISAAWSEPADPARRMVIAI
jgi:hypothetical protein